MAHTDIPLDDLLTYAPAVEEPDDFNVFWETTLTEARGADTGLTLTPARTPITELIIEDLTFPGFNGEPIRAWVTRPASVTGPLPAVIEYMGYGGGRGVAGERLQWAASGYVHVLMDSRGQGSSWGTGGDTPDPHGSGPATPGFMTLGIESPDTYYYRRLFTDAVRLVDVVATFDFVDSNRIAVTGASQGGAISLAVAALVPAVRAVMPDVPFLCHFRRSAEMTPLNPFTEISRYLSVHRGRTDATFRTLSYFDGVNFAKRITAPAFFSVALMDDVVLPSTVFAAYNHLQSTDPRIEVFSFNGHEGGQMHQWALQAEWLPSRLTPSPSSGSSSASYSARQAPRTEGRHP